MDFFHLRPKLESRAWCESLTGTMALVRPVSRAIVASSSSSSAAPTMPAAAAAASLRRCCCSCIPAQRQIQTQVGASLRGGGGLRRRQRTARLASTAAPAQPTFHDHLVSTAEILLAHARMQHEEDLESEHGHDGDINTAPPNREARDPVQAAKRESEMEKIRVALREVDDAQEVRTSTLAAVEPPQNRSPYPLANRYAPPRSPWKKEVRMTDSKNLFRIPQLVTSLRDLADSEPDEDMRKLAESDLPPAEAALTSARHHLLQAVAPSPPVSALSALVELKSGVGGNEASLFAAELVRMYQRLAQRKGWKAQVVEAVSVEGVGAGSATGGVAGAYKEALVEVTGQGAFGYLRREAGVHRVQRVPATESQGRVHTSTVGIIVSVSFSPPMPRNSGAHQFATTQVLPSESANDNSGQAIDDSDLFEAKDVKVETMRSRGAGGQVKLASWLCCH